MQAVAAIMGILSLTPGPALGLGTGAETLKRWTFSQDETRITLYAESLQVATRAAEAAFNRVATIGKIANRQNPASDLTRLNANSGGERVRVSDDLIQMLRLGQRVSVLSDGVFTVTAALERRPVNFRELEVDPIFGYARLAKPGLSVDLGNIATGYALDEALHTLRRAGIHQVLIQGSMTTVAGDPPPGAKAWQVLFGGELLDLAKQAVSCRVTLVNGQSGVIDGRTGLPFVRPEGVIVFGKSASDTEPIAAALYVLGPAAAPIFRPFGVTSRYLRPVEPISPSASKSSDRRSWRERGRWAVHIP